jgi:hypothetical protein
MVERVFSLQVYGDMDLILAMVMELGRKIRMSGNQLQIHVGRCILILLANRLNVGIYLLHFFHI